MSVPDVSPPLVILRAADGAAATISHEGAHVTSWRPAPDGDERLFLSERTSLREGVAIRGGIPVIFPQFAAEGPLPRHGFARTTRWVPCGVQHFPDGEAAARFELVDSPATRETWPASFLAVLTVRVGGRRLEVTLAVENRGTSPLSFTAALHTYLRVHDVAGVTLGGLQGLRFRESGAPGTMQLDEQPLLRPLGEVDRVYADVLHPLLLREPARSLQVSATGFPDVVVWNPGAMKAAALADMEPGGERRMLCVEAAAVQRPIHLAAGGTWSGAQRLETMPTVA